MRQEIRRLAEQVYAQVVVLYAGMDMHTGDHEPSPHLLEVARDRAIAFLVGMMLPLPSRDGVGRGGYRREPELAGDAADRGAEIDELVARLLHRIANLGADLDLGAQELGADLAAQRFLAFLEQLLRRLLRELARVLVDEEIFLLDADAESGFLDGHGAAMWHNCPALR